MRKDVKIGMLIGTGLCLIAVVWFCMHQQVVEQPQIEDLLSQKRNLFATGTVPQAKPKDTESQSLADRNQGTSQTPLPASDAESIRIHTVKAGETLSDISRAYYGTSGNWKKIYEANKEILPRGPDTVRTGMKLIIPK